MNKTRNSISASIFCFCLLFGGAATSSYAAAANPETLDALDKRFQRFSADFYKRIIRRDTLPLKKYASVTQLKAAVDGYLQSDRPVHAIALVHHNLATLRDHIDALEIAPLTAVLLKYNDWQTASRIFNIAREEAGKPAVSNISFVFARYYMRRKKWQQVLEQLDDVVNDLSVENANYAHLMIGTVLQQRKKHRAAVKYYQKVNKSSRYYPAAVLNTAIAYIRQDWWTDAHIIINDLISQPNSTASDQMVDRLHLVMGYALLRKEYFRNSRDAFRNVRLNSPYTNKALLGIALTAVNQEDFIGALNAVTRLKEKKTTDLSVDESYLLLAYTYGKLKQYLTAASAYTDAIKYYQGRIAALEDISKKHDRLLAELTFSDSGHNITIRQNDFNYASYYPSSFFSNYANLLAFSEFTESLGPEVKQQYDILLSDFNSTMKNISLHLLTGRIEFLQSYLNQSRYGLARLYDSSLVSAQ